MESSNYDKLSNHDNNRRTRNRRANNRQRIRDDGASSSNERLQTYTEKAVDKSGDGSSRDLLNKKRPDFFPHKSFAEIAGKELDAVDRTYASFVCAKCGQPIAELSSAIADKTTDNPLHFDCVLQYLQETENLKQNEKIIYIGHGRFAVAYFENPHDLRHFSIVRTIEWEPHDKKYSWRVDISGAYSQIH